MDELTKKIKSILKTKLPDYSNEEVDDLIQDYGEISILETLDKSLSQIKHEEDRKIFGDLISSGNTQEAFEYAEKIGVDVSSVFEEISKKIVMEIFAE